MPRDRETRPATLRLRRGVDVLVRGNGLTQVGLDPRSRVLLPDTPTIAGLLHDLRTGTAPPSAPGLREVVAVLRDADLLVDEEERRRRHRARGVTRVGVVGPDPWRHELGGLLRLAGLSWVDDEPTLTVLLSPGEPDRDQVDRLTHPGDPVLLLAVVDARVRVGPFVLPGVTACLRCVDAHMASADPWHPTALAAARSELPLDLPPLLLRQALVAAAGDALAWAEGRRPVRWSATTWLDEHGEAEHEAWTRHPHCGCSWGDGLLYA